MYLLADSSEDFDFFVVRLGKELLCDSHWLQIHDFGRHVNELVSLHILDELLRLQETLSSEFVQIEGLVGLDFVVLYWVLLLLVVRILTQLLIVVLLEEANLLGEVVERALSSGESHLVDVVAHVGVVLGSDVHEVYDLLLLSHELPVLQVQVEHRPHVFLLQILLKYVFPVHSDHWDVKVLDSDETEEGEDLLLDNLTVLHQALSLLLFEEAVHYPSGFFQQLILTGVQTTIIYKS